MAQGEEIEIVKETVVIDDVYVDGKLVAEKVSVEVEIEGKTHLHEGDTITAADVARLGGWVVTEGVLLIDADNNEHKLELHEVIKVETGLVFAKKVKFKRG